VRVMAPGKLVLTGAYAVLEGAPAIVVAVDRYALADVATPDEVDVRAMHDDAGRKLGLGSSAAAMVATHAARELAGGADLRAADVRDRLLRAVRQAHAVSQCGGSGVDVAAAVHGGALRYALHGAEACVRAVELPAGVVLAAFWSGTSARTSDLRARVDALQARSPRALADLGGIAVDAASALDAGDARAFVGAADAYGRGLAALGHAADAPIVPRAFADLATIARAEGAAFLPSGAGGGDVAVWLGPAAPSVAFVASADALAMRLLPVAVDRGGVRVDSSAT
jgi:phosphomevalonate kinase